MMRLVAVQRCPVVEDDHWIFTAEFERAVFETLGSGGADNLADRRGSSQGNSAHDGMLGERRADFGAKSGDDVDNAFGNAGVG